MTGVPVVYCVVVSLLAFHTADQCSNPGSNRILTGTSLVDSCQSNVMSTTIESLTSSHSGLNFLHVMKLEINARSYESLRFTLTLCLTTWLVWLTNNHQHCRSTPGCTKSETMTQISVRTVRVRLDIYLSRCMKFIRLLNSFWSFVVYIPSTCC